MIRLKDSDVTWLYGPLHTVIKEIGDTDRYAKPKVSTTEDTLGLMTNTKKDITPKKEEKKPIVEKPRVEKKRPMPSPLQGGKPLKSALKKVTMSDILKRSASELQIHTNDSSNISISEANQQLGAFSPAVIASHRQPKLRFNQYVEQCVALTSSDDDKCKKKSRLRMVDLNDVTTDTNEDDSSDSYEPGDESDAGSIMIKRKSNKVRSSIKKIEPALLKTNSRSDPDLSSSDEDDNDEIASTSYKKLLQKSKSSSHHNTDWDAESAESDALLNHIITASKGKQPMRGDPAADRIPLQQEWDEEIPDDLPGKSDYEYEFDDDDWDTSSEHVEDVPFSSLDDTQAITCQISKKAPPAAATVDEHQVPQVKPSIERTLSDTSATEENRNSSLFTNIAHWASSHLWPAED